jgi:excisionase family DNA binding protein
MARYATTAEAATYLRVSERTLYRWRSAGLVPSHKVRGRVLFDLDELDRLVAAGADLRPDARTAEEYAAAAKSEARNRRRRLAAVAS